MKKCWYSLLLLVYALLNIGCEEEVKYIRYSDIPRIKLESFRYENYEGTYLDSMIVTVSFQDGGANLGVTENDVNRLIYLPDPSSGAPFRIYDPSNPDPDLPPYDCSLYAYAITDTASQESDTIRADFNRNFHNFSITMLVKFAKEYREFDLLSELCRAPLDGRFPKSTPDDDFPFKFHQDTPFTGRISYKLNL